MKKIKHDHKGTKLLKLGIFASLMLAPLFAIAFKCAYVTFNKNAKDSYSDNKVITDILDVDDLVVGNRYTYRNFSSITSTGTTGPVANNYITYEDVKLTYELNNENQNITISNSIKMGFYKIEGNTYISLYFYNEDNQSNSYSTGIGYFSFEFTLTGVNSNVNFIDFYNNQNTFQKITVNNTLDKAFYYAIDEMKNNELFNWTTNTALYTPTAAMTNGMGITTNALPILITYWLYLTAIYIVIDIVVELFTALTHMITSKLDT